MMDNSQKTPGRIADKPADDDLSADAEDLGL